MSRQVVRDALRSLAASAVLLGMVVGLPLLLVVARGWPLPSSIPSMEAVGDALGGASISDGVLLDALACLSWLAWALLTWCAVVEVVAWAKGRAANRVPGAGGIQVLVRHLVVSSTLVLSAARSTSLAPVLPAAAASVVLVSATQTAAADAPVVADPARPALPTCIVQPRDSLWRLAERHLGDPFRWREIYELNHGRSFADGTMLRDADLIRPGWELLLPENAIDAIRPVAPSPIRPVTTAEPTTVTTVAATDRPPAGTADPHADDDGELKDGDLEDDDALQRRMATTALLLAGVVGTLAGLRRRQRRLREPGHAITLPGPSTLSAERVIRAAADLDGAERVDLALRALAAQTKDAPTIDAVRVDGDEIEVLFAADAMGVDGLWTGVGTRAWQLAASVATEDLVAVANRGCIAPALVAVGRTDAGDVMIDLEAAGRLTVHGERTDLVTTLWSLVLDLATHRWADDVRVVVHGLPGRRLDVLDRVEVADDLTAVVDEITFESDATATALDRLDAPSTWLARLAGIGDGWAPTIVVIGPDANPVVASDAAERLAARAGVAVLLAGDVEAPIDREARLVVAPRRERVALLPLDLVLEPATVPDDLLDAADELLQVAAAAEPGPPLDQSVDASVIDLRDEVRDLPAERVIVRILGRVEIDGGRTPIDRRRVVEFVTLLALHPRGLSEGQIKAALWTDQEPTTNAFNQVVSRARRALGLDSTGQPHVRFVEDCIYRPGPELVTDWSILESAWVRARSGERAAIEELRLAVDGVRGLPFEGTKGYEWAYEIGLPSRIEALVDEARLLTREIQISAV